MYISAAKKYKDVIVWERHNPQDRVTKTYPVPYYFYAKHESGPFKDILGNKLQKYEYSDWDSFNRGRISFMEQGERLYESDITAEYKILSENYFQSAIPTLNITLFDIEVDYDPDRDFATPENAYAPINAISLHNMHENQSYVLTVPSKKFAQITLVDIPPDILEKSKVILCKNEKELLLKFLGLIENTDLISGWNSDFFDVPYVFQRLLVVLGEKYANLLSFSDAPAPKWKEVEKFGLVQKILLIFGRVSLDYLEIFKKFEAKMRQSYALESIAEEALPHLPKLQYEGSLYDLYNDDFFEFLRYNVRDTEILTGLESKYGYINLSIHRAHSSTGLIPDVTGTIKLAEMAIINFAHNTLNCIVPDTNKDTDYDGTKFGGAFVLDPQIGMHDYFSSVDIVSLYPTTIRALNISPETVIGQFYEKDEAYEKITQSSDAELLFRFESASTETKTAYEWKEWLVKNNYIISGYGTVFTQEKQGIIPAILSEWFSQRISNKKKYSELKKQMDILKSQGKLGSVEYNEAKRMSEHYYRIQYIMKINLNSIYGALGNRFFKFYDVRLAESTTKTGRQILMHMVKKTAELLDGKYQWPSESTIYSDTDSCYFKTHTDTSDQAFAVGKAVENKVNSSFPQYMQMSFNCNDDRKHLVKCEMDIVAPKGIFVAKKLYAAYLTYSEGNPTDEIKIMGLQMKKTTLPKPVSKKLTSILESLLKGTPWPEVGRDIVEYREKLLSPESIMEIGLPKGINKLEIYTENYNLDKKTRLPGHVAASILWNMYREKFNDTESPKITTGTKIRTFNLKRKIERFNSIAVPADIKKLPEWFTREIFPIVDYDAQALRLVDKPLENILKAIGQLVPTRKTLLFDELAEY